MNEGTGAGQEESGTPEPDSVILVADDMDLATPEGRCRARGAKEWSAFLAFRLNASLSFLHVDASIILTRTEARYRDFLQNIIFSRKPRVLRTGSTEGVRTRWLLSEGRPASEILRLARRRPFPVLITLGTHARRGLNRLLFGSVAGKVLRDSNVPVMLIGPRAQESTPPPRGPALAVIQLTDFADETTSAKDFALWMAGRLNAKLEVIHCAIDGHRSQDTVLLDHLASRPVGSDPAACLVLPARILLEDTGRRIVAESPVPVIGVPHAAEAEA